MREAYIGWAEKEGNTMTKQTPNNSPGLRREEPVEDMPMRRYGHDIPQRCGCCLCRRQLEETNWLLWEQNRLLGEILAALEGIIGQNGT